MNTGRLSTTELKGLYDELYDATIAYDRQKQAEIDATKAKKPEGKDVNIAQYPYNKPARDSISREKVLATEARPIQKNILTALIECLKNNKPKSDSDEDLRASLTHIGRFLTENTDAMQKLYKLTKLGRDPGPMERFEKSVSSIAQRYNRADDPYDEIQDMMRQMEANEATSRAAITGRPSSTSSASASSGQATPVITSGQTSPRTSNLSSQSMFGSRSRPITTPAATPEVKPTFVSETARYTTSSIKKWSDA